MADLLGRAGRAAEDVAHSAGQAAGAAAQAAGRAAAAVFGAAVGGVKAAAPELAHAARDEAHGAVQAAHDLVDGGRHGDVAGGASLALGDAAKAQGQALADIWAGAGRAAGTAYRGVVDGVREAGAGLDGAYDAGAEGAARAAGDLAGPGAADTMRDLAQGAAQPVRTTVQAGFGLVQGVAEGAGSAVHGLGDLVVGGVRMSTDAQYRDRLVARVGAAAAGLAHGAAEAARHPGRALNAAGHAAAGLLARTERSAAGAVQRGQGAEWVGHAVGRAGFEAASFLLPAAKAGEAAGLAGKVDRAAGALADAGRAGEAAEAGAGARAAGTATRLRAAARGRGGPPGGAAGSRYVPKAARDPAGRAATQGERVEARLPRPGERTVDGQGRALRIKIADRMTAAHGKLVGEAERQAAIKHLSQVMPASLLRKMEAKGLKVVVTDASVTDHATDLDRRDFAGTLGLYRGDTREIIIPTRALDPITGQGVRRLTHGRDVSFEHADSTLLHEYGHAIDDLYGESGELSAEPVFAKVCTADAAAISRFCQRPDEPAEAFTEMFAHVMRDPGRVRREAPTTYAYFGELMGGKGPVTEAGVSARKAGLYKLDNLAARSAAIVQRAQAGGAGTRPSFNDLEAAINGARFENRYGGLEWVNPTGATTNSLARAQAVDRMVGDGTRIPARGNAPTTLKGIRNALARTGSRLGPPTDGAGVKRAMLAAGEGSHAIVTGTVPGSTVPRFWNVVVHDGTMLAVDAGPGREGVARSLSTPDLPSIDTGSGGQWSGLHNFDECHNIRLGTIKRAGQI